MVTPRDGFRVHMSHIDEFEPLAWEALELKSFEPSSITSYADMPTVVLRKVHPNITLNEGAEELETSLLSHFSPSVH